MNESPYLLLKASATHVPLAADSVNLIIATPPYLGERRTRKHQFCARSQDERDAHLACFLEEAARLLRPGGNVLLHWTKPKMRSPRSKVQIVFDALKKRVENGTGRLDSVAPQSFSVHYEDLDGFSWFALPSHVYRALIKHYSRRGDTVVHVFAGSGNGGIAALELSRRPVLIDLHYHRFILRRLERHRRSRAKEWVV